MQPVTQEAQAPTGVIIVDKPAGPTSFEVVRSVRRAYQVKRVGHTGTLDPFATGVLAICVGRGATRLVPWLQRGDKEYQAEILLGERTDTLDPTGEVVAQAEAPPVSVADVSAVLAAMRGTVMQTPPAFSALKVRGRRAYDLARRGEAPELAPRPVELRDAEVLSVDGPRVRVRIRTGPGFYVRALARDVAEALGSVGRLDRLRRTETGAFRIDEATPLANVADAPALVPPGEALRGLPAYDLDDAQWATVRVGKAPDGITLSTPEAKLLSPEGALAAIAAADGEGVRLLRVFDTPPPAG